MKPNPIVIKCLIFLGIEMMNQEGCTGREAICVAQDGLYWIFFVNFPGTFFKFRSIFFTSLIPQGWFK
jgi:hypothetical protein